MSSDSSDENEDSEEEREEEEQAEEPLDEEAELMASMGLPLAFASSSEYKKKVS